MNNNGMTHHVMTCLDWHGILSRFAMSSCDDMSFGFHLFSNGIHGFPSECHCFSMDFMGLPMDFICFLMDFIGFPMDFIRFPMGFMGGPMDFLCFPMDFIGFPWTSFVSKVFH